MIKPRPGLTRLLAACLVVALASCASSAPLTKPNDREWNLLLTQFESIEAVRKQAPKWTEKSSRREQIEILLETYRKLEPLYTPFMDKLGEYSERTSDPRAIRLFANEKIRMGDEYLNVLARYDNALTMYQSALAVDPENGAVTLRIAEAQSRRFVNMDRFAQVKQGMTEEQVRRFLGQPREDWIKQVIQRNRVYAVWIYPKPDGGASAIYFDAGVVYHTNWNAAPSKVEAGS